MIYLGEIFGRIFYYSIILLCGFTCVVALYEFIGIISASSSGTSQFRQPNSSSETPETVFQQLSRNFKLSNLKMENLSHPIYARQAFLLLVFTASLIRALFMLLQLLLPVGLFYLNYFIIIPSLFYYGLYVILSCYFTQLYYIFYATPLRTNVDTTTGRNTSNTTVYTCMSQFSSYVQYLLLVCIPMLLLLFLIIYSTKASTKTSNGNDGSSTVTTTTTTKTDEFNLFVWVYLIFQSLLLISLLYSGLLIFWKIYIHSNLYNTGSNNVDHSTATNSSNSSSIRSGVPTSNELQVVRRLLIILTCSSFGIIASILYSVGNMSGRYENWMFPEDALMYGLSEIFPTFVILMFLAKTKFSCFNMSSTIDGTSSSMNSSHGTNLQIKPESTMYNPVGIGIAIKAHNQQPLHAGYGATSNSRLITGAPTLLGKSSKSPTYQPIPQNVA